jgi:hypothetical protein
MLAFRCFPSNPYYRGLVFLPGMWSGACGVCGVAHAYGAAQKLNDRSRI